MFRAGQTGISLSKDAIEEGTKKLNRSPTSDIMTKKEIITALNDSESRIAFIFDALDKGILINDIEVYLLELREMQTKIVDIQNFIVCISLKTKGRVE